MQAAVITFDHLAFAFLGCYGNPSILTPNFDELAAGSVVFDQCFGTTADRDAFEGMTQLTEALRASGGYAVKHNCRANLEENAELRPAIVDWRQVSINGFPALLWLKYSAIESLWSAPVDQILACWRELYPLQDLPLALAECGIEPVDLRASPEHLLVAALPQLLNNGCLSRDRVAATPMVGRLRRCVYAAAVTTLDAWLGDVLNLLNAASEPNTLLIITAGAGDLTGLHAELSAGFPPLVDPLVRVPLLIRTGTPADGTRRGGLVSTTDLAPTLAEWLRVPHPLGDRPESHSLWPLLRDESHAVRDQLLIGSPALGWNLRTLDFACLCDPGDGGTDHARLFVKPDDAWDTLDVAQQYQATTADYIRRIQEAACFKPDPAGGH
jgi:hypothetical protein